MGSASGSVKTAAKRVGVTVEQYEANIAAGLKHCGACRMWLPVERYAIDRSRHDGLCSTCLDCRRVSTRKRRVGGPPDQRTATLAVEAVRRAVRLGFLEPVRERRCADCGQPAAHYHHHKGYARTNWLEVVPLCVGCHQRRHVG